MPWFIFLCLTEIDVYYWRLINQVPSFNTGPQISAKPINPLNADLNPICHLLALLGAHPILHISRIRVNVLSTTYMCLADDFRLLQNKLFEITCYLHEMPVDRSMQMLFDQCTGTPCAHAILEAIRSSNDYRRPQPDNSSPCSNPQSANIYISVVS
jgi:hypothetical protein